VSAGTSPVDRVFTFKNSLSALEVANPTGSYASDRAVVSNTVTIVTTNFANNVYLLVVCTLANSANIGGFRSLYLKALR